MILYTPEIGSHIDRSCAEACTLANAEGLPVKFQFNDLVVIARPGDAPETVRRRWDLSGEEASRAYRRTPEYTARQKQEKHRAVRRQEQMRQCVRRLPRAVRAGERGIVEWCAAFVPLNDWTYTHCDQAAVAERLKAAGYAPGDCVHHPEVQTDPHVMARWIVGQVLDGLVNWQGVIHPMIATFAEEWLEWERTGVLPARTRLGEKAE